MSRVPHPDTMCPRPSPRPVDTWIFQVHGARCAGVHLPRQTGAAMTPSTATNEIRQLFDRYADTYPTPDVDAVVALHAPDSQFWLHLDNEPAVGREAIAETFARFFAQWPNFGFEVYGIFTGPDHWVLDWALTAELTRPDGTAVPVRFD